jgi:hypothetical protein
MNKKKLLIRIIVSPLILSLLFISYTYQAFSHWFLYLRYGGEWITYKKNDKVSIQGIYNRLKNETNEQ